MTRQTLFFALLLASTLYGLIRGGRPEQIGAATLFAGAWASVLLAHPAGARFNYLEAGILATDVVIWGIFLWLSIQSSRFWPLWVAALLGAEVLVHIGLVFAPRSGWKAYMAASAMWSWVAQPLLIIATWRHRRRLDRYGVDVSWKR